MNWSNPIKQKKIKQEDSLKDFKKKRPIISNASLKRICAVKNSDLSGCQWLERWLEQFVRENSYPPKLISDDFYSLLNHYFEPKIVVDILEKVRKDYRRAFPLSEPQEEVDTLEWLIDLLRKDPVVVAELPPDYLRAISASG